MIPPAHITPEDERRLLIRAYEIASELERRQLRRKIDTYFPDTGELCRERYKVQTKLMAMGAKYKERFFIAANRVGKSETAAYEVACHATGEYPDWWTGRRFDGPVKIWACGDTSRNVRDINQQKLLGEPGVYGTGMIPGDAITRTSPKTGIPDAVDQIWVKHVKGGNSVITFKSYEQGRKAFQGTAQHFVWLDEEPPADVYSECLTRTMTTAGLIMLTFTPLQGLSDVVLQFMPGGKPPDEEHQLKHPSQIVINATWDDAPHLSEEEKEILWTSYPPYIRNARTRGIPAIGAGAIYPVGEDKITCEPFELPPWWPRIYGMDVGWNHQTAAVWGAWDVENDVVYVPYEYGQSEEKPAVHADGIKAPGEWIPGKIDPSADNRSLADGLRLMDEYERLGLNLSKADNSVEAGIHVVYSRMVSGRLKIFRTCTRLLSQLSIYRRNDKGKVVKEMDDFVDALRYMVMAGPNEAAMSPMENWEDRIQEMELGRSSTTGY